MAKSKQATEPPQGERQRERERHRGRSADSPREIPAPGWRDIFVRVRREIGHDNLSLVAAGLAFYALIAIFPALAAAVSVYGMFASPAEVASEMEVFSGVLPNEAAEIIRTQLQNVASRQQSTLGVGAILGLLLALWGARGGMAALITATNIAYEEEEKRSFFRQLLLSLALTIGGVVGFILVLLLGVAVPIVLEALPLGPAADIAVLALRWVLLWGLAVLALAVVYRYAPARRPAQWRWVTWGSAIAATLWVVGSALFGLYVRNFGKYGETYGALGGVIVLLLWFYLSAFFVLLGAKINAEMERQTARDTTEGPGAPMGQRGAYAADTLGPSRE